MFKGAGSDLGYLRDAIRRTSLIAEQAEIGATPVLQIAVLAGLIKKGKSFLFPFQIKPV
jgi:hypothetical protein